VRRTVIVVREPRRPVVYRAEPTSQAFTQCFAQLGWKVRLNTGDRIAEPPDLVAGWGFRDVMHDAWDRWPERVLHVDAGFWTRDQYHKLELGGRWLPATGGEFPHSRFRRHNVAVQPTREIGNVVMVCGMSAKAAISCGLRPEAWEREAIARLRAAGATVIYRPKPSWTGAARLPGAAFEQGGDIQDSLRRVHGVASHHSNAAVDAIACGLPVYVEQGIAKPLAVAQLEQLVGAKAPDVKTRREFLAEVAYRQWSMPELAAGIWLKPPAPLAGHPLLS
jgi:hypothetical protein